MRDTMAHRGPDDAGTWVAGDGSAGLGHRRLSIVDLSAAGHQHMCNEDGTIWITYNGEIYNHAALRSELEARGHRYRSHTDTETILHLYEEEGPRCVERLQGMFAFAIWDERRRELFLARDRLGVKPLYYAQPGGGFVFASEIKALLRHPAVPRALDEDAFVHYLTFACTPVPMTLFAGVKKLAPAERMVVKPDGSITSEIYWSPFSDRAAEEVAALDDDGLEERLLELLRGSIAKRMMSDVPFGVFLSGGVDSSTNVALMSELMSSPVQTFSVGFTGQARYNELDYARTVAERFGADHHEVVIDVDDLEGFLPDLIYHQDEPIADWVCVPLYFVSRLARESGTIVVQIGEGADEIFHGYDWYVRLVQFAKYEPILRHMPQPLRTSATRAATSLIRRTGRGNGYANAIASIGSGRRTFWGGAIVWHGDLKKRVLRTDGRVLPDSYSIVDQLWRDVETDAPNADLLQGMTYVELKRRLSELLLMRVDKMTMATSVEARVPFLDHELVEFAMALPRSAKVQGSVGKALLKRAVRPIVGADVVDRPKQGFGAPVSEWFRGPLGDRAQELIKRSSLAERGLLDYDVIDELWTAHRGGANWGMHLWNVLNASAWHDQWIAQRESAAL